MMSDYDAFAEAFDAHAATSAYNAHYDRPATLSMLGDVRGMTVLDAGCGPGHYAEQLVARGADVVGIDASAKLIRRARNRVEQAEFRVHDLESPLSWIDDDTFDRIVMALVLHHLHDPRATLSELRRVLRPNGRLVISTVHPVADWLRLGGSYFTDERLEETWQQDWRAEFRRAPLTALIADFAACGFVIESLVEPEPAPSMADTYPAVNERLSNEPGFIAFSLIKHPRLES